MPGSYADLLREAQARQDAERRADAAEAKLARVRALHSRVNEGGAWCAEDGHGWPCHTIRELDSNA